MPVLLERTKGISCLAVAEGLRPYSFSGGIRMRAFIKAIFEAGQVTPAGDNIDQLEFIPSRSAITHGVSRMASSTRKNFSESISDDSLQHDGGMPIDGVTLKLQDKKFYDLTLHYVSFEVTPSSSVKQPHMHCRTLLLAEAENRNTASDIRMLLNQLLISKYGIDFHRLSKSKIFTLITDYAAVMPNIVGASVSRNVAPLDEKWMGCVAHQLNTLMKACIESCSGDEDLRVVADNLLGVKVIVRVFKHGEWHKELPDGLRLIQEVDTRFSTTYHVVRRFVEAAPGVITVVYRKDVAAAKAALQKIFVEPDAGTSNRGYPALETIIDACDMIAHIQGELESSEVPTVHLALPMLQRCYDELDRIAAGGKVKRGFRRGMVRPHALSRMLCTKMRNLLKDWIVIHDLWLAAGVLHPLLREFQCVQDPHLRAEYKEKREKMVRSLYTAMGGVSSQSNSAVSGVESNCGSYSATRNRIANVPLASELTNRPGKKQKFSLAEYTDSLFIPTANSPADEVSAYLRLNIATFNFDREELSEDDFAALKFWYQQRNTYRTLFKVACKVFATPVSSCASERVFSSLKRGL